MKRHSAIVGQEKRDLRGPDPGGAGATLRGAAQEGASGRRNMVYVVEGTRFALVLKGTQAKPTASHHLGGHPIRKYLQWFEI